METYKLFIILFGFVLNHSYFVLAMDLAEGTKRDAGVIFHKMGIGEQDTEKGFKGWKLRTLSKFSTIHITVW